MVVTFIFEDAKSDSIECYRDKRWRKLIDFIDRNGRERPGGSQDRRGAWSSQGEDSVPVLTPGHGNET